MLSLQQLPYRCRGSGVCGAAAGRGIRQALPDRGVRSEGCLASRSLRPARTARWRSPRRSSGAQSSLSFTADVRDLKRCRVFIVTVPAPIDEYKRPDLTPLVKGQPVAGHGAQDGRRGDLRIHRLPGLHRRSLRAHPREGFGPEVQPRFLRRLQPRAHQPGRQAAPPAHHPQGHLGFHARGGRVSSTALYAQHHHGRHAQGLQHQGGRGRQGHREHPARRQHRADQRAGADLQPPRHRHRRSAAGRAAPSGTSCRSGRAWSAATASAWTPTT